MPRRFDFESEYVRDLERYRGMDAEELRGYARQLFEAGDMERFYRVVLGNKAYMEACLLRFYDNAVYLSALHEAIGEFSDPLSEDGLQILVDLWAAEAICKNKFDQGIPRDDILAAYVWLGYEDIFLEKAKALERPDSEYHIISVALAQKGDLGRARYVADLIDETLYQEQAYVGIIDALLEQSKPEEALALIDHIHDTFLRCERLCQIGKHLAVFDQDKVRAVLDEAVELAIGLIKTPERPVEQRPFILSQAGAIYKQFDTEQAEALFSQALNIARGAAEQPESRIRMLCAIGKAFHQVDDPRGEQTLDEAHELFQQHSQEDGLMVGHIALGYLDVGNPKATGLFETLWSAIANIEDRWLYNMVVDGLAQELAKRGYFEQALGCVKAIRGDGGFYGFSVVVKTMVEAGRVEEALNAANKFMCPYILGSIALGLAKQGDSRATEILEEMREISSSDGYYPIQHILRRLVETGQIDKGLELILNPLSGDKDSESAKEDNLEKIVEILVEQEQFDQALEIVKLLNRDKIYYEQSMEKIAVGYAKQENFDPADGILKQMNVQGYPYREALVGIGVHRAKLGQFDEAQDIAAQFESRERPSAEQEMMRFINLLAGAVGQTQEETGQSNNADEIVAKFQAEYEAQADTEENRMHMALVEENVGASHMKEYAAIQIAIAEQLAVRGDVEAGIGISTTSRPRIGSNRGSG